MLNEAIFIIIGQRIFYILFQAREVEGGFIFQSDQLTLNPTGLLYAANANSKHQNL